MCGKVLRTRNSLQKHKKAVHFPKPQKVPEQCSYCGKWYSTHSTLQTHVLNMHIHNDREHRCEICGFVSSTREAKKKHIRFKHTAEKRHKCHMCEKAFKVPTLLRVSCSWVPCALVFWLSYYSVCHFLQEHLATHTGVDLYKCAYCETTFKSKSNRSNHCKRHHPLEYQSSRSSTAVPYSLKIEIIDGDVDGDEVVDEDVF